MDKDKLKSMLNGARKRPISELNNCITCKLCKGYFIDATTIIECLHTFCRSCIVRYLESNKYCPICDVQVHKTKPLLNIRRDKTIQDLVYKLVPRLYQNEAKRRKLFYEVNLGAKPSDLEENTAARYENILAPDESVNVTLSYHGCSTTPRYFRCPSAVSIAHITRLICAKYELSDHHKVDVFHNQDVLNPLFSLMDLVYMYSWKKKDPLDLTYKIYEYRVKKPKLESEETNNSTTSKPLNNNNWKEVQLRISENGEMSITGIEDAGMLQLLDATENFKSEIVINESKITIEENKETPQETYKELSDDHGKSQTATTSQQSSSLNSNSIQVTFSNFNTTPAVSGLTFSDSKSSTKTSKCVELSEALNLNNELSVVPLNASTSCVSLSSCGGTTTVFTTINKTMCSTKSSDEPYKRSEELADDRNPCKLTNHSAKEESPVNSISKDINALKRKLDEVERSTPPKQLKPTILNHSINLMHLSNNHPLKKHSKLNRNGERRNVDIPEKLPVSTQAPSDLVITPIPSDMNATEPIIINKCLNYNVQMNKSSVGIKSGGGGQKNLGNVPCYMPKAGGKAEKNGEKNEGKNEAPVTTSKPSHSHNLYTPIITPSQLPHHQNLNHTKPHLEKTPSNEEPPKTKSNDCGTHANVASRTANQNQPPEAHFGNQLVKSKPTTPIGYKTLRDPPKSWNSQINSQIARVNQNAKAAQQMAAVAAASQGNSATAATQGRYDSGLKSVRPAKFFKGRNMPRYLGNPASGVKPMYQVHLSPEKDKHNPDHHQHAPTQKSEKSEIKKHSIVKIDPKTLKPISEKAPETSNLSNISTSLSQTSQELRLNAAAAGALTGDLKINTSSVSIFNPLKLQQNSPKSGERRSPKSPHSPKIKTNVSSTTTAVSTSNAPAVSCSSNTNSALSPKQQREKTNLTFTPPNPFVPNLTSPTMNPNQFLYPAGGFPSYDPRFMAACHSLWYSQRLAAAAAAGLVTPAMTHGLSMGLNIGGGHQPHAHQASSKQSSSTQQAPSKSSTSQISKLSPSLPASRKTKESHAGASSKTDKSLENALEKLNHQNKTKENHIKLDNNKEVRNGSPVKMPPKSVATSKNLSAPIMKNDATIVKKHKKQGEQEKGKNAVVVAGCGDAKIKVIDEQRLPAVCNNSSLEDNSTISQPTNSSSKSVESSALPSPDKAEESNKTSLTSDRNKATTLPSQPTDTKSKDASSRPSAPPPQTPVVNETPSSVQPEPSKSDEQEKQMSLEGDKGDASVNNNNNNKLSDSGDKVDEKPASKVPDTLEVATVTKESVTSDKSEEKSATKQADPGGGGQTTNANSL